MSTPRTYRESGVDIDRGEDFARFIGSIHSPAILKSIGGFAGGISLDIAGYREPVLLSSTDGVGTKLLVAREVGRYDTIGIDLVAMCVNDLLVCGANPLLFLDYIACGTIDETILHQVMQGIVRGCEIAGCVLAGGETAEMPDMYAANDLDLAGFSVGLVERSRQLPRTSEIGANDIVLGVASSGVHSNGFSLVRKVLPVRHWEQALAPTTIYSKEMHRFREDDSVLAAAHITGGGLEGNIMRILPEGLSLSLSWDWPLPTIFSHIQQAGTIDDEEMRRVFNMGVGLALVVRAAHASELIADAAGEGIDLFQIGKVIGG